MKLQCGICGRFFEADDPDIIDCKVCLRYVCRECFETEQHYRIDYEFDELMRLVHEDDCSDVKFINLFSTSFRWRHDVPKMRPRGIIH